MGGWKLKSKDEIDIGSGWRKLLTKVQIQLRGSGGLRICLYKILDILLRNILLKKI